MDLNKYLKEISTNKYKSDYKSKDTNISDTNLDDSNDNNIKNLLPDGKIDSSRIDTSLNEFSNIFMCYNSQIDKLNRIEDELEILNLKIDKKSEINDVDLKKWYEEDIPIKTRRGIDFSEYQKDIVKIIDTNLRDEKQEISVKKDEYFSNLYYLIQIKNDLRKDLSERYKEISNDLQLSENEFNSLTTTLKDWDKDLNMEIVPYSKIDNLLKSIADFKHKLSVINDYLNLIHFDNKELNLVSNGLNLIQKEIYDNMAKEYIPKYPISLSDLMQSMNINNQSADNKFNKFFLKKINEDKEIANIEMPNIRLKSSVYNVKKYLKSNDGLSLVKRVMLEELNNKESIDVGGIV